MDDNYFFNLLMYRLYKWNNVLFTTMILKDKILRLKNLNIMFSTQK